MERKERRSPRMHRQPEHVMMFLLAEMGTSGSLDGQQRLVIKGRFVRKTLKQYSGDISMNMPYVMDARARIPSFLRRIVSSSFVVNRCTFEDRILMSDIVFMRAWVNVEVPTYCNLVTTALQPRDQPWQGMRTTAELRRAHNLPIPHNKDSVYKPMERKVRKFNPVEIPAKLQHLLPPFKSKPKDTPKRKKAPIENRVPVLLQPSEKKKYAALQQLMLLKHEKARKKRIKDEMKKKAYEAEKAKTEQLAKKRQREERRVRYREEDKQKKRARR